MKIIFAFGIKGLCCSILILLASSLQAQTFTNQASAFNLDLDGKKDGGFSFADIDNDNDLDLIVNTNDSNIGSRIYIQENGTFTDLTASLCAGCLNDTIPVMERCVVFADFNDDGYKDFVRNTALRLEVYINKGPNATIPWSFGDENQNPNFVKWTDDISNPDPPNGIPFGMNTEGIGAFDFDNDGDLDLFIENHQWGVDIYENVINEGNPILFTHYTPASDFSHGLPQSAIDGDYASVTDYDNDGYIDASARKRGVDGVGVNDLFKNLGNGEFERVVDLDQANNDNKGAVSFYDLDNDGDFDIIWTENLTNRIWEQEGVHSGVFNALESATTGLLQGVTFTQIDAAAGGDIDNDGDIDIFMADDGGESFLYINQLKETGEKMKFVRDQKGIAVNGDAEGSVFVDFDQDGDRDLYINIDGGLNQLWVNDLNDSPETNNYLIVEVLENRMMNGELHPDRPALGATIVIKDCDGNVLSGLREVNGGNGHGTQDPFYIHFGTSGFGEMPLFVEVSFPFFDGETERTIVRALVNPSEIEGYKVVTITPQTTYSELENDAPLAMPDYANLLSEDLAAVINLLENDSDPNDDPIAILDIQPSEIATIEINEDQTITYMLNEGISEGKDSLWYIIQDMPANSGCTILSKTDTAYFVVNIIPEPRIVANDDIYQTDFETPIAGNVTNNDIILNPTLTTVTLIEPPENGSLEIQEGGEFIYTPDNEFLGKDFFLYSITDSTSINIADTATVCIIVGPQEIIANDDEYFLPESGLEADVSMNDIIPNPENTIFQLVEGLGPATGTLVFNPDGTFTYNSTEIDSVDYFFYVAIDSLTSNIIDTAKVTITLYEIIDDELIIANDDLFNAQAGEEFNGTVIENDILPHPGEVIFEIIPESGPENGAITFNPDGSFSYLPDPEFIGTDCFLYRAIDENTLNKSDTAQVCINVCSFPQANEDFFELADCENIISGNVAENDVVIGNDVTFILGEVNAPNGTLDFNEENGSFTYTINNFDFFRDNSASFKYKIQNECGESEETMVTLPKPPIIVYKVITPNGDRANDLWIIDGIENYPTNEVWVYNRWGNNVFTGKGYDNVNVVWDGSSNDSNLESVAVGNQHDLPSATYFYVIQLCADDSQKLTGNVILYK